jgi:hypothetical protein
MECPVCSVSAGSWHRHGCGWEQCPYCGAHAIGCACGRRGLPLDDRIPWSGSCPWLAACREFGFFERSAARGWTACRSDEPGSLPDIRRLLKFCHWDRLQQRFVRRQAA